MLRCGGRRRRVRLPLAIAAFAAALAAGAAVAQSLGDALTLDEPDEPAAPAAAAAAKPAPASRADAPAVAARGVALGFYRNLFSQSMEELSSLVRARVAPDISLTLPDFTLRDPWTLSRDIRISRCYGAVLDAWVTAQDPGEYRFVLPTEGGHSLLFVSEDGTFPEDAQPLELKAETLADMPEYLVGWPRTKTAEKARVTTRRFRLKAGGRLRLRALFVAGLNRHFFVEREDRFFVGWTRTHESLDDESALALGGAGDAVFSLPAFKTIPARCLEPAADEPLEPRLVVGNPTVPVAVHPTDDEPDSLCWDLFATHPALVAHFLDWAATNPPPGAAAPKGRGGPALPAPHPAEGTEQGTATAGVRGQGPRPFVWLKTAEQSLVSNDGRWSNTNLVAGAGVVALRGPDGHATRSKCHFDVEIAEPGDYRVWCRYWRKRATSSGTFNLDVLPAPSANPAEEGVEAVLPRLSYTFARTNPIPPYRPLDPTPDIMSTPYPADGWSWEGSAVSARLEPGRYRFAISLSASPAQSGPVVTDFVLTADPGLDVGALPPRAKSEAGSLPASATLRNPLYAIRPGAGLDAAPPERLAWWRTWRDALFDRLCDAEHTDYVWGKLATLSYFDDDSHLIGRVREVRAQRSAEHRAEAAARAAGAEPPRVGDGDLVFWSQDPFGAFSRTSPPASGYKSERGVEIWTPLDAGELCRAEHAVDAVSGEIKSMLLLVRNNADAPVVVRPAVESPLPASVRLVAYTVTASGLWSPQILLRREEVVCPPRRNTALWVTADCRGAKEGDYPVTLRFADKAVTWRVAVRGSFDGVPKPYLCPYARPPYSRKSSWELFRDYGLDIIGYMPISRKTMHEYGIRLMLGVPLGNPREWNLTEDGARKSIAKAEAQGLRPGDYAWFPFDEPGPDKVPAWTDIARMIKSIDTNQWVWCDLGDGVPKPEIEDRYFEMMKYWDVACPFVTQFNHDPVHARYLEALHKAGRVKLVYHTLCGGEKSLRAPLDILNLADFAIREGRDGFANFSMANGAPYDDLYVDNQDEAVSIYPGSQKRMLSTRNLEAFREGGQRMRRQWMKGRSEPR